MTEYIFHTSLLQTAFLLTKNDSSSQTDHVPHVLKIQMANETICYVFPSCPLGHQNQSVGKL